MKSTNIAVYTCIIGNYDILLPPTVKPDGVRFYCFTDRSDWKVKGWEMLSLTHPPSVKKPDLINRYHKLFPHRVLPEVSWSIYIDGNVRLTGDIISLIDRVNSHDAILACPEHLNRSTIFEEAQACEEQGKFDQRDQKLIHRQLAAYKAEGMPDDLPLSANYLVIRNHDSDILDRAMELWWKNLQYFTRRDQISLPYVLWKSDLPAILIKKSMNKSEPYYERYSHKKAGFYGWYQWVYMHRNEKLWCHVLYSLRKWFLPE